MAYNNLSRRLSAIAALVPVGIPMADIGTDHGLLPIDLVQSGRVPRAIGIDDKIEPLLGAKMLCQSLGIPPEKLELRHASGCVGLGPEEAPTLTLAGIGGPLIAEILQAAPKGTRRIILQPNVGEGELRIWLVQQGWEIDIEQVVQENDRFFTIMAARPGAGASLEARDIRYGALACHQDMPALHARLSADHQRLSAVLARQKKKLDHAPDKILQQLAQIEDVQQRCETLGRGRVQ